MGQQYFMEPKNYFEPDATEVKALQREAGDLRSEIESRSTSWVGRTRAEVRLGEVERLITAGHAAAAQRLAEQQVQQQPQLFRANNNNNNSEGRYVQCDGGGAWLWIPWDAAAKSKAANAAAQQPEVAAEQQFAPTVPYFEKAGAAAGA